MLSRHTRGGEKFLSVFCLLSVLSFFASCFFSALIVTFFAYLIILYLIFLSFSTPLPFTLSFITFFFLTLSLKEHFPFLFSSSYSITLSRAIMSQTSLPYLSLPFSKMQYFSCHHFLCSKAPPPHLFHI